MPINLHRTPIHTSSQKRDSTLQKSQDLSHYWLYEITKIDCHYLQVFSKIEVNLGPCHPDLILGHPCHYEQKHFLINQSGFSNISNETIYRRW